MIRERLEPLQLASKEWSVCRLQLTGTVALKVVLVIK
jgi:hypothetical protein